MTVATMAVPLAKNDDGVFRIGGTRVTLDTLVAAFVAGATPEEIALRYPSLHLAGIYAVIGYYLQNQAETETYLQQRRQQAGGMRQENEHLFAPDGIRARLLQRPEKSRS